MLLLPIPGIELVSLPEIILVFAAIPVPGIPMLGSGMPVAVAHVVTTVLVRGIAVALPAVLIPGILGAGACLVRRIPIRTLVGLIRGR